MSRRHDPAGYVWLLAAAIAARVVLSTVPITYVNTGQAVLWSWPMCDGLVFATLLGARLAGAAEIPPPLDPLVPHRRRFLLPAAWRSLVGGLIVLSDRISPVASARGVPTVHVPFPASVPFYAYGEPR